MGRPRPQRWAPGLIVLVVAILAAALSQATDIGEAITSKIMELISKIGGG